MSDRFGCLTQDCTNWGANQDSFCFHARPFLQDGKCVEYIKKETAIYVYPMKKVGVTK